MLHKEICFLFNKNSFDLTSLTQLMSLLDDLKTYHATFIFYFKYIFRLFIFIEETHLLENNFLFFKLAGGREIR